MADSNEKGLLKEKELLERELLIQRQIAYAAGLFQEDVTIRTLLESLGQGIIIIDTNGAILLVNARAEQMFGYKSVDIIGKSHDILIPKRVIEKHQQLMSNYFKEPRIRPMGMGLTLFGVRSDGTEFPLEISLSYVKTRNTLLVIALISDISFRVAIEKSIQTHIEELAEANEALESFSYSVSHDLRAPLAAMISLSKILKEDYSDKLDEDGQSYLNRIISSGNQMNQLISDMLNLSRITKKEVEWQDCNLGEMAKIIFDELQKADPSRNVEMIIHEGLMVKGDPMLLNIALTNLLSNAWKFTGRLSTARIEFGSINQGNERVFFIKDNGVGFKINHEKIFKPFQRMHTDKEFPGTGIGLAIVDRVIKRHKGKIWAESEPGKGSTFYFTIQKTVL